MLKELFEFVLKNYKNGFKRIQQNDPNLDVLINQIPSKIYLLISSRTDLLVVGSSGKGQKTDHPWIAIFNKNITISAQRGLYIVYLFKKDLSGFYLTLNQGITYFNNKFKSHKYECARKVANYFKQEIGDTYFDRGDIDLATSRNTLGFGYQETNIISKYYAKSSFTESELKEDFRKMLAIYDELVGVLGENNYDYNDAIDKILTSKENSFETVDEAIENIKSVISSPTDVNVFRNLKMVEPKEKQTNKYEKLRKRAPIKKIDYIKKAKTDMEIGQLGEMLALQYEKERLIKDGLGDLADKVRRVSIVSDHYGYDIESFDVVDSKLQKIFIEVKTTVNKLDVAFPVSQGEVDASNKKKSHYCIFRIYDAKSATPCFYKVFGKIRDNFKLDPESFMATYVGKKTK